MNSQWTPSDWQIPTPTVHRFNNFKQHVVSLFRKRHVPSNLLSHRHKTLRHLQHQKDLLVVQCDKKLGPTILEYAICIKRSLQDHLLHREMYQPLSNSDALQYTVTISNLLKAWSAKYYSALLKSKRKYTHTKVGYLTMKVQKDPYWAIRPIVSCSGSLLYSLAIWVDCKLN